MGLIVNVVAGVQYQRAFSSVFRLKSVDDCFLAGKTSRLVGASPARFNFTCQAAAVNNSQCPGFCPGRQIDTRNEDNRGQHRQRNPIF